jgi:uncharacterized protein involved in tolerance to divalent cations
MSANGKLMTPEEEAEAAEELAVIITTDDEKLAFIIDRLNAMGCYDIVDIIISAAIKAGRRLQ